MKVLVLLLKGFETMEFSVFVDVIGWAREDDDANDCNIKVETCGLNKHVTSTFGVPVIVDKLLDEINIDEYDALALPGGFESYGFYEEGFTDKVSQFIREFYNKDKIIASICVAALILGKSGILNGKKATTYRLRDGHRQKQLEAMGGITVLKDQPIVVDGKIITSYNPQTAPHVAFKLLELLTSTKKMNTIKYLMGYSDEAN
ncbi:hypothetical protein DICPUDRAFT_78743 [Dictyostelium purpureum]|uniref:DJ-1/PfpI domain-containing protein n=1 Tax=Dictyostelium purpureum TaxID=5786 RepID=F0ZKF4_DICPU|nr:uncharacterized protein DICPUDRAFT_78743 [Dictyostelium purpureum]EGC35599.1 hypothetical protein DICPUDRAFT_78743 [Dictyostelium purpureum]|eukprot:XP_003287902.1 hypothetical protein DICPUDRAFT_78743 [Dictyostelium purpureum]